MWSSSPFNSQGRRQFWVVLLWLSFYVGVSIQQRDPIDNFCRRWGHQSAVVDNKLYIDGGLVTYSGDSKHTNVSNPYLIYHDLSTTASSGMPPPYKNLSKNSTIPNVNGGILWPDTVNKRLYLYGGEFYGETAWDFSLYGYDIINNNWNNFGSASSSNIRALSYGAGLSIPGRGEGYYYGGWMNGNNDPNWSGTALPTSYMLIYDMDKNEWKNKTGPDTVGRAEGVMLYVPAGDGGMIVYFGGVRGAANSTWEAQPMDEIIIYDVLSGKSYTQNATGDVPESRRRFCAGVTWADDQSSYNIYLYGGLGEKTGSSGFDDAYILTLPTFTWVKIYPATNGTGDYPHHSLSCNIVNEAQMIIHGGFFPLTNDCDTSDQWGLHNMDLGKQNTDKSFWALWDPSKTSYAVPTEVVSVVGGKTTGGATKTKPAGGWDSSDVGVLMTRKASAATRSATRNVGGSTSTSTSTGTSSADDSDDKKLGGGAIAGIAVGAVAGVALIAVGIWFLLRRRRAAGDSAPTKDQPPTSHAPDYQPVQPQDNTAQSPGPWSPNAPTVASMSPPPFQATPPPVVQSYVYPTPPVELPTEYKPAGYTPQYPEMAAEGPKVDAQGNVIPTPVQTHPSAPTYPNTGHFQELPTDANRQS